MGKAVAKGQRQQSEDWEIRIQAWISILTLQTVRYVRSRAWHIRVYSFLNIIEDAEIDPTGLLYLLE
jgi:hypothetical protein